MRYTLLVLTAPDGGASARHALGFAQAAQGAGHEIACVFFFDAGVLTALTDAETPQDEFDLRAAWSAFATTTHLRLLACVASAARFGLIASQNASDDVGDGESDAGRLRRGFSIAGLGELIDATDASDRVMTFAG
jgi:tRNA 2-thiouridine synthesizing protein D